MFGLTSISCPTARLCVASDDSGVLTTTHPASPAAAWTRTELATELNQGCLQEGAEYCSQMENVDCPSARLCVAVDGQDAV